MQTLRKITNDLSQSRYREIQEAISEMITSRPDPEKEDASPFIKMEQGRLQETADELNFKYKLGTTVDELIAYLEQANQKMATF